MHGLLPSLPNESDNQIQEALEHKQEHMKLNHDNKHSDKSEPEILPIGTQVMVEKEDAGPWTHGIIIDHSKAKHSMRSYRINCYLTGCIVTRNTKPFRTTVIQCWMYKYIEKLKQTDIDNDQDKHYSHYTDKVLPDNTAMPTPSQTLESPHINLARKSVTSAVKGVEPKYEQPFVVWN